MTNKIPASLILAVALLLTVAACGRKGDLEPPPGSLPAPADEDHPPSP